MISNMLAWNVLEATDRHLASTTNVHYCKFAPREDQVFMPMGTPTIVAIFAEEIAKSDKPSTNGTKRCKSEPIIVLKASSKQVIDCSSGVIIGPYDETKQNPAQSKRGPPAAHNKRRKFYQYICVLYAQNIKRKIMWMLQQ